MGARGDVGEEQLHVTGANVAAADAVG